MTFTRDALLGGRVILRQPSAGFRAGSDAVLLAAACPARPGERVLDLGCGVGAAMLCVAARVPGALVTGLERDARTAALARGNGAPWSAIVVEGDATDPPPSVRAATFDHVILNPPYFAPGDGTGAVDPARERALREAGPGVLAAWCDSACRRAGPKGTVTVIARAERLADLLAALAPRLGGIAVLPLAGAEGRAAKRVVVHGAKQARAPLRLLAPFVTHEGGLMSPIAQAVLRDAAPLALN